MFHAEVALGKAAMFSETELRELLSPNPVEQRMSAYGVRCCWHSLTGIGPTHAFFARAGAGTIHDQA